MNLKESIHSQLANFISLCKAHKVSTLYAFGSSITDHFDEETSDIDLLIEVDEPDPIQRGESLLEVWDKFEKFFQRKVDLLTNSSIKNPILKQNIDASKVLIYDGKKQEVSI